MSWCHMHTTHMHFNETCMNLSSKVIPAAVPSNKWIPSVSNQRQITWGQLWLALPPPQGWPQTVYISNHRCLQGQNLTHLVIYMLFTPCYFCIYMSQLPGLSPQWALLGWAMTRLSEWHGTKLRSQVEGESAAVKLQSFDGPNQSCYQVSFSS